MASRNNLDKVHYKDVSGEYIDDLLYQQARYSRCSCYERHREIPRDDAEATVIRHPYYDGKSILYSSNVNGGIDTMEYGRGLVVIFDKMPEDRVMATLRRHKFTWSSHYDYWVYTSYDAEAEAVRITNYLKKRAKIKVTCLRNLGTNGSEIRKKNTKRTTARVVGKVY